MPLTQPRHRCGAKTPCLIRLLDRRLLDKPTSSTQAPSSGAGDAPTPKGKAIVRKRPAQSEDESGTLPPTPAGSQISQPEPATTDPQQPIQPIEESQAPSVEPQQGNVPVEGAQPSQSGESTAVESSGVKKRMVRKGSAAIAEQGSLSNLREDELSTSSIENPKAKSPSKPKAVPPKQSAFKGQQWSEFPDDPPESFNTAVPATVPMAKSEQPSVPKTPNPSAAAVAAPTKGSGAKGKFLLQTNETSEWPVKEPKIKLPLWKKKDAFLGQFLQKKGCYCTLSDRLREVNCTPSLGGDAITPKGWKGLLHPNQTCDYPICMP